MVIFGQAHLWRILSAYAVYYNQTRTHLALNKDCPLERPIQRFGSVAANSRSGWTTSSVCPDMISGKDSGFALLPSVSASGTVLPRRHWLDG
jgi:hypothetical protein